MKDEYPEYYLRGIANSDFVSDGHVLAQAFQFDDDIRRDNYRELSINWEDDDEALNLLLSQRKDNGKFQFKVGAARLSFQFTKMVLSQYIESGDFAYERHEVEGNVFHGNLLISASLSKQLRAQISNGLALVAGTSVIYRE